MQSYTPNRFQNKEKRKRLLSSYLSNFKWRRLTTSFQKRRRAVSGGGRRGPLKSWRHLVLAVYGQGFRLLHNANHRWVSSLDAIDRPHETKSAAPPKRLGIRHHLAGRFWSPLPPPPLPIVSSLSSPLLLLLLLLLPSTMHISDQGWMSGSTWELLISGSVLVVSCLRIHTNKGQWSHATGLTRPVFLSPGTSTCLLPPRHHARTHTNTRTHAHTHLFFFLVSLSRFASVSLSTWPLEPLRFTKHLQTAPL